MPSSIYKDSKFLEREHPSLKLFKGGFHDKSGHGKLFMTLVNNKLGIPNINITCFSHKPKPDAQGNKFKFFSETMTIPQIRKL